MLEKAKEQITDASKQMEENQKKSSDVQRKKQSLLDYFIAVKRRRLE